MKNEDARLIRKIAWWVGGENCADDVSNDEYAIRIIKMVRDHDKRLTKRAPDVCPSCAGEKQVIGEDGTIWVCGICGGTGKRG